MLDLGMEMPSTGPQVGGAEVHTSFGEAALWLVLGHPASVLLVCWSKAGLAFPPVPAWILSRKGSCQKRRCLEGWGGPMEGEDGLFALFHFCHFDGALSS